MSGIKRGDWVVCPVSPNIDGIVRRVARDKSWADVEWNVGWSKRMPVTALKVVHTIKRGDIEITDMKALKEGKR